MSWAVYRSMPYEDYATLPGLRAGAIKTLLSSPLEYHWGLTHQREETDALRLGTATHLAILEPERFEREVSVWGERRAGKLWDQWSREQTDAGHLILNTREHELICAQARAVREDEQAGPLLAQVTDREISVTWDRDERPAKARLDAITSDGVVVDLKSAADVTPRGFAAAAWRYGYHVQAAWYLEAALQAGLTDEERFAFLTVGKRLPIDAVVYEVSTDLLHRGREQIAIALERLERCEAEDHWPGVAEGRVLTLDAPSWADRDGFNMEEE